MTKRLCTLVSLLLTTVAGAQTQKGNGLIGGGLSVGYNRINYQPSNANQREWQSALNLTVGRFVADNWLLGAAVAGTSYFRQAQTSVFSGQAQGILRQSTTSVDVDITPFVRRYWQLAPVQVFAGAGLSVGINGSRITNQEFAGSTQQITPLELRTTGFQVSPYLEAGVNYFLTNRLALQLSATAGSLPFNAGSFNTGLVYWTGPDRKADPQSARENKQTNGGNWLVEGGFGSNNTLINRSTGTMKNRTASGSYAISPSVGYFVSKNNILGLSIPLLFGTNENIGQNPQFSSSSRYWSVGFSPYFQHYWTSTRLTPYTRLSAAYSTSGDKLMNNRSNTNAMNAALGIGLAYMAGNRFIVETSLATASLNYGPISSAQDDVSSWSATLSGGLRGNFAIRYVLTRVN